MKKRTLLLLAAALLLSIAPAAASNQAQKSKSVGKHNFEQWQTIKRLQIRNDLQ